jgi:hypothetical protein
MTKDNCCCADCGCSGNMSCGAEHADKKNMYS